MTGPWRLAGAVAAVVLLAGAARAATWGGITPGTTTLAEVRALHGTPSRERTVSEGGRSAPEWTYAGEQAPLGLERMVVSFGLIRDERFLPEVVRAVALYPRPRIFTVAHVTQGWGKPDALGTEEQTRRPAMRYERLGLLVVLDPQGEWAEMLLLAPEKPGSR